LGKNPLAACGFSGVKILLLSMVAAKVRGSRA